MIDIKKYQVIYADPPWKYNFSPSNKAKIEQYYKTMDNQDIINLPINKITDINCVLYLWATAPKLIEALNVMKGWGFSYKTNAIWDKDCLGMGYWFVGQHEILLVGTKGIVSPPKPKFRVSSIYTEKKKLHAVKPSYFRDTIARSFPNVNKIELFARTKTEGWDVWGDEIDSDINLFYDTNK